MLRPTTTFLLPIHPWRNPRMGAQGSKSTSAPPKITSHDRAILDLKVQRDKIRQYQKRLLTIESTELSTARTLLSRGDKARALSALRRGKYQRSLLEKTDGQLRTLEDLVSNIEFSQIQASVYHGLERGNEVLKEMHKTLNAESVEKLLEQTSEAQERQREIDEMLATRMTAEEEAEVQQQMELLEKEQRGEQLPQPLPTLPDAPTTQPQRKQQEDEEDEEEQRPQKQDPQRQEERQAMLA